jgi:hypothetical protein
MNEISTVRLYLLRAAYLLLVVGLGSTIWPAILHHAKSWELMHGVVICMLGAMSALAVLGLRYPLQMLPLLLFELTWKVLWLTVVALPLWSAHQLDADTSETIFECALVIVILPVIPWDWVFRNYIAKPGDPWVKRVRAASLNA